MKTHNWLRPRARLFAVNKVSLRRSAARRACSFPPRCKLLQSSWIIPSPSGRTCYCCSLTRSHSRGEFSRSMPRLSRRLPALGYDTFTRYAAVGNNSGPNQAALYRGRALRSRQDLGNSTWLWDKLGHKGYATFKGEVRHMPHTSARACKDTPQMTLSIRSPTHRIAAFSTRI